MLYTRLKSPDIFLLHSALLFYKQAGETQTSIPHTPPWPLGVTVYHKSPLTQWEKSSTSSPSPLTPITPPLCWVLFVFLIPGRNSARAPQCEWWDHRRKRLRPHLDVYLSLSACFYKGGMEPGCLGQRGPAAGGRAAFSPQHLPLGVGGAGTAGDILQLCPWSEFVRIIKTVSSSCYAGL